MKLKLNKKEKITRREGIKSTFGLLILGLAGGLAGWRYREDIKDMLPSGKPDSDLHPAMMFVLKPNTLKDDQGQVVNSAAVKITCKKLGIDYRCYHADANLFQEAQWVRDMHKAGVEFGAPCLVLVDLHGRGSCKPVPASLSRLLTMLEKNYGV